MKIKSLEYVRGRIRNAHPRTRKALLNTVLGLVVKGGGMGITLILVPITIDYLSKENYGTWLTISSVVTMLTFFDVGIGNGLRNKVSEAISNQDHLLARSYVSTAYLIFGLIQAVLFVIFLLVLFYVPWQSVFNTTINIDKLRLVLLFTVAGMAVKLVLDIISYILFAIQEPSVVNFVNFISNLLILCGTYLLTQFSNSSIIYLAIITAISPVIVLLIFGYILYKGRLNNYRPTFRLADMKHANSLLSLGYKFFVIQLAVLVMFFTDNLIITQLFGPSEVTTYNVAFRYFNAINILFSIAVTPYWSAFTEAHVKGEKEWMKKTYNYLQRLWLILVVIVVIMVFMSNFVYNIWVGDRVVVPPNLSVYTGLFVIVSCWNSITVAVANGVGVIKLQLVYALSAASINIPLAILFGQKLGMGSAGIILATTTSLLFGSILGGIQAKKLISGTATGIWSK